MCVLNIILTNVQFVFESVSPPERKSSKQTQQLTSTQQSTYQKLSHFFSKQTETHPDLPPNSFIHSSFILNISKRQTQSILLSTYYSHLPFSSHFSLTSPPYPHYSSNTPSPVYLVNVPSIKSQ
jgi:hypothetical protein